ncbi:hypothetical protein HF086_000009 [Spodoptera exigua]|uniref:Uncharacterized protein n=1 Tax=Spodoptera exigua TaxID=7107 RepID=A0A922SQK6_SPOEX|nr:hypothetical protein HF086_000009 [Spodoptera exigua]
MKLATEIFIVLSCTIAVRLVIARNIVKFNMKKFYPDEQRVHMIDMTGYDRAAHPEPLPTMASKTGFITYSSLHQGVKLRNDVVVYNQTFNYNGTEEGQRILCQALFDCSVSFSVLINELSTSKNRYLVSFTNPIKYVVTTFWTGAWPNRLKFNILLSGPDLDSERVLDYAFTGVSLPQIPVEFKRF